VARELGRHRIVISNAGIMFPGPATAGPGRRMEPDGGPCRDSRTSPRPLSRIWGTVGVLSKAGVMVAHLGPGRRVRDEPADLDLRGHRYRSCFGPPRSVR